MSQLENHALEYEGIPARTEDEGWYCFLRTESALKEREEERRQMEKLKDMYSDIEPWRLEIGEKELNEAYDRRLAKMERERQAMEQQRRKFTPPSSPEPDEQQQPSALVSHQSAPTPAETSLDRPEDAPTANTPVATCPETPRPLQNIPTSLAPSSSPNVATRLRSASSTRFYRLDEHSRMITVPSDREKKKSPRKNPLRPKTGRVQKMSTGAAKKRSTGVSRSKLPQRRILR